MVDLDDGRDLGTGSAEEQLVARVELGAVDAALNDILAKVFFDQSHDQRARDAFEDVIGDWRRHENAVLEHEQVLG